MPPRLRLTVVNAHNVMGGAEQWLLSMLDAAMERLDVRVIMLGDSPLRQELCERGIPVTVRATGKSAWEIARASLWVRRQLKRHNSDLVLANGVKSASVACPAARMAGVRSIWVKHDHSFDGTVTRLLGRLATRVATTAAEVGATAGRDDVVVIPPPRPTESLSREDSRSALENIGVDLPEYANVLAMVGRFAPYKNIETAIQSLPFAEKWHLLAIGGDDPAHPGERKRLSALAHELDVTERVHFTGHVDNAARLLPAADALAVLTAGGPVGREGYCMAAVEGMLAQLPIIAIDDDGPTARRIAPDESGAIAGLRIAPHAPEQLADALADLDGPVLRQAIGAEAHSRVKNTPDAQMCGENFANLCAQTALRPGAGRPSGLPLSIVTPVLNEAKVIDSLLASVQSQLGPDDEYFLVDGGSHDETRDIISTYAATDPRIRLVDVERGKSIAHSRNMGIQQARHEFVACIDAGCDPDPQWMGSMRAAAADGHDLVVGVYKVAAHNAFQKAMAAVAWPDPAELRRATPFRLAYGKLLGRSFSPRRVDGRSVGFRRKAWESAGGFPEDLVTAEDEAFGRRILAIGYRSVQSLDAAVTWHQRPNIAATFQQFRRYGMGGGKSKSALLLARDAARLMGYAAAAIAPFVFGMVGTLAAIAGAAVYLSMPISRLVRRRERGKVPPLWLIPALPFCYLVKDVAKVTGTLSGLATPSADASHGTPEERAKT